MIFPSGRNETQIDCGMDVENDVFKQMIEVFLEYNVTGHKPVVDRRKKRKLYRCG